MTGLGQKLSSLVEVRVRELFGVYYYCMEIVDASVGGLWDWGDVDIGLER